MRMETNERAEHAEQLYWRMRGRDCALLDRLCGRHIVVGGTDMQPAREGARAVLLETDRLTLSACANDAAATRAVSLCTVWQVSPHFYDWHEIRAEELAGSPQPSGRSRRRAAPIELDLCAHPLSNIAIVTLETGVFAAAPGEGPCRPPDLSVSVDIGLELAFSNGDLYHVALEDNCVCGTFLVRRGPFAATPPNRVKRRPVCP